MPCQIPTEDLAPLIIAVEKLTQPHLTRPGGNYEPVLREISVLPNRPAGYTRWPEEAYYSAESRLIPGRAEYITFIIPLTIENYPRHTRHAELKMVITRTPAEPPEIEWRYTCGDWQIAGVDAFADRTQIRTLAAVRNAFTQAGAVLRVDANNRRKEMKQ